jgi:hypothetical protein
VAPGGPQQAVFCREEEKAFRDVGKHDLRMLMFGAPSDGVHKACEPFTTGEVDAQMADIPWRILEKPCIQDEVCKDGSFEGQDEMFPKLDSACSNPSETHAHCVVPCL